ncbi:MAG: amidohydrolase family protein [Cyclobacteriaceae bacterium]
MKHSIAFKSSLVIFLGMLFYACNPSESPSGAFDVLITNATIIDGTGAKEFSGDILIRADTIAFIGDVNHSKVDVSYVINAEDKVVTPGFIDAHAHGDPVADADFKNFRDMGVTTIALGQDGFSYASENLSPWMTQIDSTGLGVNVITFVGHSTLRELSGTNYSVQPTDEQLASMKEILRQNMIRGAFGLSTGLEYTPGYYAQAQEMEALAKVVGDNNGIIMSHMRNEDDDQIEKSINELLLQGSYAPVHISHFKVVYGKGEERAKYLLSMLDSARQEGVKVTADVYPYTASYTGIGIVFPDWAKAPNDFGKIKVSRRAELEDFLRARIEKRNGPDATLFGDGPWRGMTLTQVSDSLKIPFEKVLIDVVGPEGTSGAYFVMNEELQTVLIQDSLVCISSDGSPTMHHPRGYGSFAKIIRQYVNETQSLGLSDAIRKMTSLPATIMGLKKRGVVKVGYKADLLVFDPIAIKDKATYEAPHQYADGFEYVIINGHIAKSPDAEVTERYGLFIRKE